MQLPAHPIVKICGVRTEEMARFIVAEGGDWIGLNLSPISKRNITLATALRIADAIRSERQTSKRQGKIVLLVYKNPLPDVLQLTKALEPDLLQVIYGDPSLPSDWTILRNHCSLLPALSVDRVILNGDIPFPENEIPILDAPAGSGGGGTGKTFPWERLAGVTRKYLLAGGLQPGNVEDAIQRVHPWGVDVASGVEDSPGLQSKSKIREFIRNATRQAQ